jgi:hypothetical protein
MKQFCVIENSTVINIVMAESKEVAEELFNKQCIESYSSQIAIGSVLVDGTLKPYASWILNEFNNWEPPKPWPNLGENPTQYAKWNEQKNDFDLIDL